MNTAVTSLITTNTEAIIAAAAAGEAAGHAGITTASDLGEVVEGASQTEGELGEGDEEGDINGMQRNTLLIYSQ